MYFGKPLCKEDTSLPLLLTLLIGGLLLQSAQSSPGRPEDSTDFWSTAEVSENEGHGVEALCDMSFLQTGIRTDNNVLSSIVRGRSTRAASAGAEPETLETVLPLSLLQVDEWVGEEVQAVRTGEGFVLHDEVAARGTGFTLKANAANKQSADAKLPMSLEQLRILVLVLKFLFALCLVVKGGAACARLIERRVAPLPTPSKELKEAVSAPKVEKKEPEVEPIPLVTAAEVEQLLPSFRSSYDCALSKPKSVGQPLRFRARIYGPLDDQHGCLAAPMCEEACVFHETKVEQNLPGEEAKIIAERRGCVDFVATLEGAPDLQLTIHGKEVRMCSSCRRENGLLRAVPAKWRDFVQSEGTGYTEEDPLSFQEEALRVGQLVTLVGDLHRDASGQLLLWPAPALRVGGAAQALAPLLDGVHVLVSDDPNFGAGTGEVEAAELTA